MADSDIGSWLRPYFSEPAGEPSLYYVVFGPLIQGFHSPGPAYRCAGIPASIGITAYGQEENLGEFMTIRQSIASPEQLREINPQLADRIFEQRHCIVIRGKLADTGTLNEFRDVIGLITYLLDAGGVAVFDVQSSNWWERDDWHRNVFDHGEPAPVAHVTLWYRREKGGTVWLHTRGMRKFGRPDLSLRRLPLAYREAAEEMLKRLIGFQAFGGAVADGQEIQMQGVPAGIHCRRCDNMNDETFNNAHIEMDWPGR
ncbi:MAG: hypothetical protein LBV45_07860 [Xanthomonadaceae bacterium]|jgi:hypothetical protein|nr:hypothetical protein [Xanthomonadaceae bacterium]